MNGFFEKMQKFLLPIANVMNKNKYVKAIRDGLVFSLPYTMVGSILTALFSAPFLEKLLEGSMLMNLRDFVAPTSVMSSSIISIFVVIGIANSLSREYKINPLHGAMTSLIMLLIVSPSTLTMGKETAANVLDMNYIGPKAIFSAIVLGMIGVEIYRWAVNHKLVIKLPSSVPGSIQDSFTSFIPSGTAMVAALIIRWLFFMTPQGNMTDFIFYWIQEPLTGIAVSYPGLLVYGIGMNLCWFLGLHGQTMIGSIFDPLLAVTTTENIEALAAGKSLPNMFTWGYTNPFIALGFWISIPLLIALLIYTKKHKRSDWKEVTKIALLPGLFNIYEPLMFGLPLVLNPFAFVPMILTPIISHTFFYLMTISGIVPYGAVWGPITTPVFISGMISTNSVIGGVLQLLMMLPLAAMWYFFLTLQDHAERKMGIYTEENEIEEK